MDYYLGILCGLLLIIIIKIMTKHRWLKRSDFNYESNYDERQILARGYAYKWGYISIMLVLLVNCCIIDMIGWWCTLDVLCFGSIFIGGMVFVTISIFKDAYFTVNETNRYHISLFFIAGIVNILAAVRIYIQNGSLLDSTGKFENTNILAAVLMIYVAIMLLIKKHIAKEDGDDYEES